MNRFALGVVTACLFTTEQGKQFVDKASKVAVVTGNNLLKSKLNIDMKEILNENDSGGKELENEKLTGSSR